MTCVSGLLNGQSVPGKKHPRRETFWDMWKFTACPEFEVCSFTFILCFIIFIVYVVEVILSIAVLGGLNRFFFLGPKLGAHKALGFRHPYAIKNDYHVHRLIMPAFIHLGFTHILVNIISLMMIGFIVERNVNRLYSSRKKGCIFMMAIFLLSMILGNLFACVTDDRVAVGIEPAIFGYLAAILTFFAINWSSMGPDDQ